MINRSLINRNRLQPAPQWRCSRPPMAGPARGAMLVVGSAAQPQVAEQVLRATWTLQVAPIAVKADSDGRAATSLQPAATELDFESSLGLSQCRDVPEVTLAFRRPDWVGFARTVYRGPFAAVVATF
jgi:hypothetical protein